MRVKGTLWLILFWAVSAKLFFRIRKLKEGSIIPYPKSKNVNRLVFEDWFNATPAVMSVADGIGGVRFPTSHFAQVITNQVTQFLFNNQEAVYPESKDFEAAVSEHAINEIDNFNSNLRQAIESSANEISQKLGRTISINEQNFMAAATFISAAIENLPNETSRLNIFQKGDSGMIIFKIKKHSEEVNAYHYEPTYVSREQSYKFNMPFQFSNSKTSPMHQSVEKQEIQKGWIVLMGSDGLWDNLSLGFITYLLNYSLYLSLKGELTKDKIDTIAKSLQSKYKIKLKSDNKQIKKLAKSLFKTEKASKFQLGGFFKMFVPNFLLSNKKATTYNLDSEQIKATTQQAVGPLTDSEFDVSLKDSDVPIEDQNEDEATENLEAYFKHMQRTENEFFDCNGADLVWENYAEMAEMPLLSPCAAESIRQSFLFTTNDISAITEIIDPKLISNVIARTAMLMSKVEKNNYSPFFLRKVQFYGKMFEESGKQDDITAVIGIITDKEPEQEVMKSFQAALQEQKKESYLNLKNDVNVFMRNIYRNEFALRELMKLMDTSKASNLLI